MADTNEVAPEKAPDVKPIIETIPPKSPIQKRDFDIFPIDWGPGRGPSSDETFETD